MNKMFINAINIITGFQNFVIAFLIINAEKLLFFVGGIHCTFYCYGSN